MAQNIELKARCGSMESAIRTAEELGAKRIGELAQSDTYYRTRTGRLKIRKEGDRRELIAYSRPDRTAARKSEYTLLPLADGDSMHEALASTLGVMGEVRKTRLLYLHENVRIHLDTVHELGTFLEFEAIVDDRCDEKKAAEKIEKLVEIFHIKRKDLVAVSYSDLLGFTVHTA